MNDHQRLYSYSLLVQALAVVIKLRFFQIVDWQLRICYWAQIFGRTQWRNGPDALKAAFVLDFRGAVRMVR